MRFNFSVLRLALSALIVSGLVSLPVDNIYAQDTPENTEIDKSDSSKDSKAGDDKDKKDAADPKTTIIFVNSLMTKASFRGIDLHTLLTPRNDKSWNGKEVNPVYHPALVILPPVSGLELTMLGLFAINNRSDRDFDRRWQTAPAGANLIVDSLVSGTAIPTFTLGVDSVATISQVGFHKENNGLQRLDLGLIGISYTQRTDYGRFKYGAHEVALLNPADKAAFPSFVEFYAEYSPWFLEELALAAYFETFTHSQYYTLTYENALEITKSFQLKGKLLAAYNVQNTKTGLAHIDGRIGAHYGGFGFGVNASYRYDVRFFDLDVNSHGPQWLDGLSTNGDGLVADPARSGGFLNDYLNAHIQNFLKTTGANANYVYTPRQKMPRVLYWLDLSYTMIF